METTITGQADYLYGASDLQTENGAVLPHVVAPVSLAHVPASDALNMHPVLVHPAVHEAPMPLPAHAIQPQAEPVTNGTETGSTSAVADAAPDVQNIDDHENEEDLPLAMTAGRSGSVTDDDILEVPSAPAASAHHAGDDEDDEEEEDDEDEDEDADADDMQLLPRGGSAGDAEADMETEGYSKGGKDKYGGSSTTNKPKKKIYARQIMDLMGTSGRDKSTIGIRKIRNKSVSELSEKQRKDLVRIVKNIMFKICKSFLPEDSQNLLFAVVGELGSPSKDKETLSECLSRCRKGSVEKRLLRSIIMGSIGGAEGRKMIAADVVSPLKDGNHEEEGSELESFEEEDGTTTTQQQQQQQLVPPPANETVEERVKRVGDLNERLRSGNVRRMIQRAQNDWIHFQENGYIKVVRRTLNRKRKISDT